MLKYVEGRDYSMIRVKSGRYIVIDSTATEVGEVVGRRDKWVAYGVDGKRAGEGATRYDVIKVLLQLAERGG